MPSANSTASVTTQNYKQINSGITSQNYNLNFQISGGIKQPVAVTLTSSTDASGANVVTPMNIALCGGGNNGCGQGFQINTSLAGTAPSVGDTYTFNVAYSSGSPDTVTATVTTVLSAFAASLSPTTGTSSSLKPTFTWTDPLNASNYIYWFLLVLY